MTQYLSQEKLLRLLIAAFLLGLAMGAIYQLFLIRRAATRRMKLLRLPSVLLQNAEDLLFCIASGTAISVLFFVCTDGVLRLMAFPALFLGLIIWRLTLGRLIGACTDRILRLIAALLRLIRRWIIKPIARGLQKVAGAIAAGIALRRQKKREKRLDRLAEKETRRYNTALLRLAGEGRLPADGESLKYKQKNRKEKIKDQ